MYQYFHCFAADMPDRVQRARKMHLYPPHRTPTLLQQVTLEPSFPSYSTSQSTSIKCGHFLKMISRSSRGFCSLKKLFPVVIGGSSRAKHTLPDLPYDYDALQPTISAEIMQLHHQKHHATYVNNLNVAEEKFAEAQAKGQRRQYLDNISV